METFLPLLTKIILLIFTYYICLIVHELGHLIFGLLLIDKEEVELSFGQKSNKNNNVLSFKLCRVKVNIFLNSLLYNPSGSLSIKEKDYSFNKSFIITLGGPLFSLGIFYCFYLFDLNFIFSVMSFLIFIITLIPMIDKNGDFSDGYQLMEMIKYKIFNYSPIVSYEKLLALSNSKQYQEAINYYDKEVKSNEKRFSKAWKNRFYLLVNDILSESKK